MVNTELEWHQPCFLYWNHRNLVEELIGLMSEFIWEITNTWILTSPENAILFSIDQRNMIGKAKCHKYKSAQFWLFMLECISSPTARYCSLAAVSEFTTFHLCPPKLNTNTHTETFCYRPSFIAYFFMLNNNNSNHRHCSCTRTQEYKYRIFALLHTIWAFALKTGPNTHTQNKVNSPTLQM